MAYRKKRKKRSRKYNPNFWRKLSLTEPNNQELQLLGTIVWLGLPYRYVGNAGFIINGRNPDFIHHKERKLIELFGRPFHKKNEEFERTEFFAKCGYETLIIWSEELKFKNRQNLYKKLKDFEKGKNIQE